MENLHCASWLVGAVTFFKVSILVTFSRSQFLGLLKKCQTPLAVAFVLSIPAKGWSNTSCRMDMDHASPLDIFFEDPQNSVCAKFSFTAIDSISILFLMIEQ